MANSTPTATEKSSRDQYYVSYSRTVQNIRTACMTTIADLASDGRSDLSAPFARILAELASVDTAALKALDDEYAEKLK